MSTGVILSQHKFKKGKFIAPFNDNKFKDVLKENPWFNNRLPEYIWLALILEFYGRTQGLLKCRDALQILLNHAPDISLPKLSIIVTLTPAKQTAFYNDMKAIIDPKAIEPLTLVLTHSSYPEFACAFIATTTIAERIERINDVMRQYSFHQSNEATDVRFLIATFLILAKKLHISPQQFHDLSIYPSIPHEHIEMHRIRPYVRAMEIAIPDEMTPSKEKYLFDFWDGISRMSDCQLCCLKIDDDFPNTDEFMNSIKSQLEYYVELFQATHPLDSKMLVLLGIATYSYKRLLEVVDHNLYNAIAGRSAIRVLIEDYIMMKYLLKHEDEHEDIWTEYQYYGIGQYKLVVERVREARAELPTSHVMYDYMDFIVNEYTNKDFIDMDTSYFDKKNVREKAIDVGEKELFGFYYDYDSAFEHGLWGAIRESALLKCETPSHQYHCVPDINDNQKLQSVWLDCKNMMGRTMALLNDIYGCPEHLLIKEDADE